jgi:hypothetical protein
MTNGVFDDNLDIQAGVAGATMLKGCYSNSVMISNLDGSVAASKRHIPYHDITVILSLCFGGSIVIAVAASHYIRSFSQQFLECDIDDVTPMSPTVFIKALSATMVLYELIERNDLHFLLWTARGIEFCGWLVLMYLLLMPSKRVDTTSQINANMIPLSLKLYGPAVGYGVKVDSVNNMCGFRPLAMTTNMGLILLCAWDVTLLPMLPWTKTSTTELLKGYPSLWTCRVCLYTPLATQTLQLIYAILLLAYSKDSYGNYIFEAAAFLYWLYIAIKTVLFLHFSQREKMDLAVVSVKDLRKFADPDACQVTLMSKEELNQLRRYLDERTMETMDAASGNVESGRESVAGFEMSLHRQPLESQEEGESKDTLGSLELSFDDNKNIDFEEILEAENLLEYRTAIPFADETTEILRHQLRDAGILPLTYIPKEQLQAEINELIAAANNGTPFDEARLDYLLKCLDVNPEYQVGTILSIIQCCCTVLNLLICWQAELKAENERWRALVSGFVSDCLADMRAFIPVSIFKSSLASFVQESGYSQALAKRIMMKKCLWLVRMTKEDIQKIHASDLTGKFNPIAQGLDITELGALLGAIPEKFNNDPDGRKQKLRIALEQSFKVMWTQQQKHLQQQFGQGRASLQGKVRNVRHAAYNNQTPSYFGRPTLHHLDIVTQSSSAASMSPEEEIARIRSQASGMSAVPEYPSRTVSVESQVGDVSNPMFGVGSGNVQEGPPNVAAIVKRLSALNSGVSSPSTSSTKYLKK